MTSDNEKTRLVFRPNPEDVPEIIRRTEIVVGQPFIKLPNRPDTHKVLAEIGGHKIRRGQVEMVFNDTVLMNFIYKLAGHRSEDNDAPGSLMAQVRELARKMYGVYGQWVEVNYGVVCLECMWNLPIHNIHCSVGKRREVGEKTDGKS